MDTEEALAALCRGALPDRRGARVVAVEALQAQRHPTLAFVLEWTSGSSRLSSKGGSPDLCREGLVLRWHRWCEPIWCLEDPDRAEREFALHRALEARGFPVPHVYAWGREEGGWVLMSRSPHLASRSPHSASDPPAAWGTRLETVLHQGMEWLARLHAIVPDAVTQVPLPRVSLEGVISQARAWSDECDDDALSTAIEAIGEGVDVQECPPRLLHGNPHPASMRLYRQRLTSWLGWENSALGDPRWDLARLATWFLASDRVGTTHGSPLLTHALRAYLDAQRVVGSWDVDAAGCAQLPAAFPATLALRDWSLRRCRQARLCRQLGPDHPDVTRRDPAVGRARQRCEHWLAALRAES
jgi:aminoglycoside phosphotransferase (APT) family kinase protein